MKTLVTGGTGFIGSHLVKRLLGEGREVIVASDFSEMGIENLTGLGLKTSDVEIQKVDLRDYYQTTRVFKEVDTVFHLAARIGSLKYLHGTDTAELLALQTNLGIDTNVFRACIEKGVNNLVYTSSVAVYSVDKQFSSNAVFSESDLDLGGLDVLQPSIAGVGEKEINPDGGYGWAKLLAEIQLSWMKGMKISIARILSVYGKNEPIGEKAHVIADLIRKAIMYPKVEFTVHGDGNQNRDFLYISDCIDALLKLEQLKEYESPLVVNIGSGVPVPIGTLAKKVARISGKDIKIKFDGSKSIGPISRTGNIEKAKRVLGWEPKVSLDEGLQRTYSWLIKMLQDKGKDKS